MTRIRNLLYGWSLLTPSWMAAWQKLSADVSLIMTAR